MALEKSDWFSVTTSIALFGGGLYMSTLAHEVIRVTGLVITVAGVAGLIFWFRYCRKHKGRLPRMGDNNTLVGAPPLASMGSGNTIVGATDARGNTIINRGGTAIGAGARAGRTGIAIGANANAAGEAPRKK
jgi:hypothetical protein